MKKRRPTSATDGVSASSTAVPRGTTRSAMRRGAMAVVPSAGRGIDMVHMRAGHMAMRRGRARRTVARRTGSAVVRRTGRHVAGRRTRRIHTRATDTDADGHAGFSSVAANHHQRHEGEQQGKEYLFHRSEKMRLPCPSKSTFIRISARTGRLYLWKCG